MKTLSIDDAIRLDLQATQHTDFDLTLQFPQPLQGGTVTMELAGRSDTITWEGSISPDGKRIQFVAKYDQMSFATGVYSYVVTYQKNGSRSNLFTGYLLFKPRL